MKLTSAIALSLLAKSVYGVADHLWYSTSLSNVTDWYNEVTIHSGDEPEGTYFMTNGFTGGYFGIQHNVPNKTVLFSVWDADDGTNTTQQACGSDVVCSTFGGEGTGLHANYNFQWADDTTYAGYIKASPVSGGYTDISGYFKQGSTWVLLATYRRKVDSPYLDGFYSFVENPATLTVNETREAYYGNQWVRNESGTSQEMTTASLTNTTLNPGDNYGAGVQGTTFFLFINGPKSEIPSNRTLTRDATGKQPSWNIGSASTSSSKKSQKKSQKKNQKRFFRNRL
ncbi:hypothetical protein VKS41_008589 [Umbelopsis sp. WA50703]